MTAQRHSGFDQVMAAVIVFNTVVLVASLIVDGHESLFEVVHNAGAGPLDGVPIGGGPAWALGVPDRIDVCGALHAFQCGWWV